jgi:LAO/AO transport system kinase
VTAAVGLDQLVENLCAGSPAALARAITAVENNTAAGNRILARIQPDIGSAAVIGVTGPPGAGKSTLCSALIGVYRERGFSVGLLAVDPSSPFTGGAILGDRIRMAEHDPDPGVFVRSLAARGHLGGLSPTTARVIDVMDAARRDVVIVETVGAGQSEVDIAAIADTRVVVCAPGLGDEVQAIKAGILEIADILVVNKSDLPLAERAQRQLLGMLQLRAVKGWLVPVLNTVANSGSGVEALADAIDRHQTHTRSARNQQSSLQRVRRQLAQEAARKIEQQLTASEDVELLDICREIQAGRMDLATAADRLTRTRWSTL